jgi:hypothetical protein
MPQPQLVLHLIVSCAALCRFVPLCAALCRFVLPISLNRDTLLVPARHHFFVAMIFSKMRKVALFREEIFTPK